MARALQACRPALSAAPCRQTRHAFPAGTTSGSAHRREMRSTLVGWRPGRMQRKAKENQTADTDSGDAACACEVMRPPEGLAAREQGKFGNQARCGRHGGANRRFARASASPDASSRAPCRETDSSVAMSRPRVVGEARHERMCHARAGTVRHDVTRMRLGGTCSKPDTRAGRHRRLSSPAADSRSSLVHDLICGPIPRPCRSHSSTLHGPPPAMER